MGRSVMFPGAWIIIVAFVCHAQSVTPVVNAGFDQGVGTENYSSLSGEVIWEGVPSESLVITWTQIAGPQGAKAAIADSGSLFTNVVFTVAGTYRFELRAAHGTAAIADTTEVIVHVTLPFKVLAPANSSTIEIGKSYTIRWQMDPSKPCLVYYSLDQGKTFFRINEQGSVSDSLLWFVDTIYKDSARHGLIRVEEYQGPPTSYAQESFVLVDSADNTANGCGCGAGTGLALFPPICFKLNSFRQRRRRHA